MRTPKKKKTRFCAAGDVR